MDPKNKSPEKDSPKVKKFPPSKQPKNEHTEQGSPPKTGSQDKSSYGLTTDDGTSRLARDSTEETVFAGGHFFLVSAAKTREKLDPSGWTFHMNPLHKGKGEGSKVEGGIKGEEMTGEVKVKEKEKEKKEKTTPR